jgi:DNA ligase-1
LLLGDISQTSKLAAENRLGEATLTPFRAIKFMLASPEETAEAVLARVQSRIPAERHESGGATSASMADSSRSVNASEGLQQRATSTSVWLEDKYDGIRCQLHKVGPRVALYSRDLKEITATFLDLADSVRTLPADFVLDGEIVAMDGEEVLPFSELQKRLGRKEADLFMRHEVPIIFVAFDLLWSAGKSLLDHPLQERRRVLENLPPLPLRIHLARITEAASASEIESAFVAARARGNEGLMIKAPSSLYTPGRRGLAWLKLKKALATLDCVVVGAEYGHGKRSKVLSDYTFAVRDETSGELKVIGKAYTGLTDVEILQLTQHFLRTAIRQHGRYFEVPPDTILEIAFDKIQLSDRHDSGLAMRFPRIVRIRTDKSLADVDTLANAQRLAEASKQRSLQS